jgi:hypothetical protein
MKKIILLKDKLTMEVPDIYEYRFDQNGILEIFYPKGKLAIIKFIIIDSTLGTEERKLYNNISIKKFSNIISENIFYNVFSHAFELDAQYLYVTSFEIILKQYYINIRVNTSEEIKDENKINLIEHIHNIILTIKEL